MRPHVTLKLASSLDGRIATAAGESRWITGAPARAEVQKLRAASDAVMIGAETARLDDPELLARTEPPPARQPTRVIIASRFDVPRTGRLIDTLAQGRVVVIGARGADSAALAALGVRTFAVGGANGVD